MTGVPLDEGPFLAVTGADERLYRWDNRIVNRPEIKAATADFPSVTTIISMLDKPAIPPWTARVITDFALENVDEIQVRLKEEEEGNREKGETHSWVKSASIRQRDAAGERGSAVHKILELAYGDGMDFEEAYQEVIGSTEYYGLKDEALDAVARPAVKFFQENVVEMVASEGIVYNTRHRYAGSFDAMVRMKDGRLAIMDYKTSNNVYPTTGLQLTAYSMCDKLAVPILPHHPEYKQYMADHPELEEEDKPPRLARLTDLPVADHGIVAHLRSQKGIFYYTEFTRQQEQCIIGLRKLWEWNREARRAAGRGNPPAWTLKREICETDGVDL